jgi:hypothetical protein
LRVASALVLLGIAVLTVWMARRSDGRSGAAPASARELRPWQAYAAFLALTAVNPTTVVYFVAVVLGNPHLAEGWAEGNGVRAGGVRGERLVAAHPRAARAPCSAGR